MYARHYDYNPETAPRCLRTHLPSATRHPSNRHSGLHHTCIMAPLKRTTTTPTKSSESPRWPWVMPWQQPMTYHPGDRSFVMLRVMRRKQPIIAYHFRQFLGYLSHFRCCSKVFISYSVQLRDSITTSSFPPHPTSSIALSSLPCLGSTHLRRSYLYIAYFPLTLTLTLNREQSKVRSWTMHSQR